jgi:hypothetical protein
MAERSVGVSSAAATFRWTGSWHTAFVTTDRDGDLAIDEPLIDQIRNDLERYRMAGYDLEVNAPVHVPLRIDVQICVEATHLRSDVEKVVLGRLGSSITDDGSVGLFNPDSWTFGQPVYLSTVIATAQNVPGVQNVTVNTFARLLDETVSGLDTGVLRMDRLEIAQCNNDPNYPERGVLTVSMGGGR